MKKLFNLFHRKNKCEKFIILQWGKSSSIIQNVTSGNFEVFIIGNQELMNIEERGNIV